MHRGEKIYAPWKKIMLRGKNDDRWEKILHCGKDWGNMHD